MYDKHDAIISEFFKLEPWFNDKARVGRLLKRASSLLDEKRRTLAQLTDSYEKEGMEGDIMNLEEMTEVLTRVSAQTPIKEMKE